MAPQEIALDVVHTALLDLALVFWGAGATGGDEEAIVFGTFAVGQLHLRVIPTRFGNTRLEIVDHEARRHAIEECEGAPMQLEPDRDPQALLR